MTCLGVRQTHQAPQHELIVCCFLLRTRQRRWRRRRQRRVEPSRRRKLSACSGDEKSRARARTGQLETAFAPSFASGACHFWRGRATTSIGATRTVGRAFFTRLRRRGNGAFSRALDPPDLPGCVHRTPRRPSPQRLRWPSLPIVSSEPPPNTNYRRRVTCASFARCQDTTSVIARE
jgi:hypothetical protein